MSSFEINKIMGAIFSVALLILIITNITDTLYYEEKDDKSSISYKGDKNYLASEFKSFIG